MPNSGIQKSISALTVHLKGESERKAEAANLNLTVYLPNLSSMLIKAKKSNNFQELLNQILKTHKEQNLKPPLRYDKPKMYELRIHDGKYLLSIICIVLLNLPILTKY